MSLPGQKTTSDYLEWDSMLLLLSKLERDERYKMELLIAVGCYTGLRIGDLLVLRWKDILHRDTINITERKTGKQRRITVHSDLRQIINRIYTNIIKNNNSFVFSNNKGTGPISVQYVNRELKRIFNRYGIKGVRVSSHFMRKTLGRRVWGKNNHSDKSLILLSDLFGHSSVTITRKYLGIRQKEIEDVYLSL